MVTTVQNVTNNGSKRRRRRRNRAVRTATTTTNRVLAVPGPAIQQTRRAPRRIARRQAMSEAGMSFLKCAFASADFSVDPGKGIPDCYNGRTVSIKDCFTTNITFPVGDTYIVVAPVPGYAYFLTTVAAGVQPVTLAGTPFPTYTQNFGNTTGTDATAEMATNSFAAYRYASQAIGIYPTSNYMQFAGSVSVWHADLTLGINYANVVPTTTPPAGIDVNYHVISGLQSVNPLVPRDSYNESFIKGAYSVATDMTGEFEWNEFKYGRIFSTTVGTIPEHVSLVEQDAAHALTGLGNTCSIIVKVSTPTGAVNSALVRVWNCMELKPRTDSALFQFSGVSPAHDQAALEMYRMVKNRIPVAVPASENSFSWERVLKIIQDISSAVAFIPGPVGAIGTGVNAIANGISQLVL